MYPLSEDEKQRRLLHLSPRALLRYQVVAELRSRLAAGEQLPAAVEAVVAAPPHLALDGTPLEVSSRSVYRWYTAFQQKGLDGLERAPLASRGPSQSLSQPLLDFLRSEKAVDRYASVPELIRRARERGLLGPTESIDRVTAYRACVRMNLPLRRVPAKHEADQRRFAYPHRMMMVLSDGKHFRAGPQRTRRLALFFLDDATRYGLAAVVGTTETAALFLRGLHRVVQRFGFMDSLFLDNGPGFIADDTRRVCINLDTNLIFGTPRYPQGHGKIERFHQTVGSQVLRGLVGADAVDDSPTALELRLEHYLLERYNHTPHESLDKQSPHARFHSDSRPLRFPPSEADLTTRFVVTQTRRVSNDNVVSLDSLDYEVPRGHARTQIDVYRRILSDELFVLHDGKLVTLHRVDLTLNAYNRRARPAAPPSDCHQSAPTTAAALAWVRDLGPILDAHGGFADPDFHQGDH